MWLTDLREPSTSSSCKCDDQCDKDDCGHDTAEKNRYKWEHHGNGVASQRLNSACNRFSEKGYAYAEAYPVKNPKSDAYNFPGTIVDYLENGFTQYRDNDWYLVLTKRLETNV
ncbi:MAG: hypothetical protein AUF79_07405 [Crenarchaeota archaeon 13_1_20CM_2_51_8]|nr:MAG: hypothetical protein AUF79_07405 [Crenarchaeota archaeon 13_1_20CM_2_51_8]